MKNVINNIKIFFDNLKIKNNGTRVLNVVNDGTILGLFLDAIGTWVLTFDYHNIIRVDGGTGVVGADGLVYPFIVTYPEPYYSFFSSINRLGFIIFFLGSVLCLLSELKKRYYKKDLLISGKKWRVAGVYILLLLIFFIRHYIYKFLI